MKFLLVVLTGVLMWFAGYMTHVVTNPFNANVVLSVKPTTRFSEWACYLDAASGEMRCAELGKVFDKLARELDTVVETL